MAKREMPTRKVTEDATLMGPIVVEPVTVEGTVIGCVKLNIRENPDIEADILCEVKVGSKLIIDPDKSTRDWFSVYTETGIEGFCMKRFVQIN